MDFANFDRRKYATVSARDGYAEWSATYEQSVHDEMDLRLLSRIGGVSWSDVGRARDMACGTGRIGVWLKRQGVRCIDGIDITPEMLQIARSKREQGREVYASLEEADIFDNDVKSDLYDLAIAVLVDEHLPELGPLYREAARLIRAGGAFVMVGYHPHFIMNGIPTHFHRPDGEAVAIKTHVHLFSHHVSAAGQAALSLIEMHEGLVDDAWIVKKPQWSQYIGQPVSFAMVWRKPGRLRV